MLTAKFIHRHATAWRTAEVVLAITRKASVGTYLAVVESTK